MLPDRVTKYLSQNLNWCFEDTYSHDQKQFVITDEHKNYFRDSLKLKVSYSAFVDFYSVVAFTPLGSGSELFNLESILEENTAGSRYLRFTSIEGEGSYFYDVETDAVYDINWGEEELMDSGQKQPWFPSFSDFLEWYYSEALIQTA